MGNVKAILLDVHGTLVYNDDSVDEFELSDYLSSRGYEVTPLQLRSAWGYVAFIDYPLHGYKSWHTFLSRISHRLGVKIDGETQASAVRLFESRPYKLYADAAEAVPRAKRRGFKTATVTTIAKFQFYRAIQPIKKSIDFLMTGYEAGCDKSNPKMYKKLLEILGVKPSEAVVIGDNLRLDVVIPSRLGINTMFLNREDNGRDQFVDAFVCDLNEAVEAIIEKHGEAESSERL